MTIHDPARDAVRHTFELSRRLSDGHRASDVHRVILKHAVSATRARQGSLAIFDADDDCLRVPATIGYPQVLVEDVRITSGEGVIGAVFKTHRPLLVEDAFRHPHVGHRRARYRTASFMAVPILGSAAPLGVICVADRLDERPFEGGDLLIVRSLAASAALALQAHEMARHADLLQQWATVDPLTGLFNRRTFEQRLEEEIQRCRRHVRPVSLLLFDVDDFKQINDCYGHQTGDAALRALGVVIRRTVRAFDICCRYGGEEFALVLPDTDAAEAEASAHRIREAVERHSMALPDGRPDVQITVSAGVATRQRGEGASELVERADVALYRAKAAGKNRVTAEHPSLELSAGR